MIYYIIMSRFN